MRLVVLKILPVGGGGGVQAKKGVREAGQQFRC